MAMNLAPLANVVAYLDRNPLRLAGVKQALDRTFPTVWSPGPGCVMATRPLPHSVPDGEDFQAAGIAFAEGRDTLAARPVTELRLESLPGNVGFIRADRDRLFVVRSGPGTVPWYAWQDTERALVATTFTELVRLLPVVPPFDPLVCALWASFEPVFPDGRSFLRGVTVVPPGHTAEVRPGQEVRSHLWWDPWPEELPWPSRASAADNVEHFRQAVLGALDREVAEEPVNLLTLSGGVDSSALAYLTARHLGRPLAALSFVPPDGWPEGEREASYLDPLVADLGISPHTRLPLDSAHRLALVAETPPVAFPVMHPALQVLPRLAREWGVEILFGGEWADEVCGGFFALPDWLDAVSLPRLVTQARALPRGRSDLRAWAGRRVPGRQCAGPWRAPMNPCVRPEVEEEYAAWRGAQLGKLRVSAAPHRYNRALLSSQDGVLPMNWEVCSFLGMRRSFPFLTAEVLKVVSGCHPVEMLGPGVKRLQRQAFAELVPERYLLRPDKSGWGGRSDDVPVEPPPLAATLGEAFREDSGLLPRQYAAGLAIISHFDRALTKQRQPTLDSST